MTATDLAVVILSVVSVASVGALVAVLFVVSRAVADLRRCVDELGDEVVPLVRGLETSSARVVEGLERADGLLERADEVSARAETVSRVTYRAVADPLIRTRAVLRGAGAAGRRLRTGRQDGVVEPRREVG